MGIKFKSLTIKQLNLIGALTSKPYAFMARSWELKVYESIDIFDNFGSNVRFDLNNLKILRILPKINKTLNDNWITDKVRFCYDGLRKQRLNTPTIRKQSNYISTTWKECFSVIKYFFNKTSFINSYTGDLVDLETLYIFKEFLNKSGNLAFNNNLYNLNSNLFTFRNFYISTLTKKKLKKIKNLFLIGLDIRLENPILNLNIRKSLLNLNFQLYTFGFSYNLTYSYINFGNSIFSLINFFEGTSLVCQKFKSSQLNFFILGYNLFYRNDFQFFLNFFNIYSKFFNNFEFNNYFPGANTVGNFELSYLQNILKKNHFSLKKKIVNKNQALILYLLDSDFLNFNSKLKNKFYDLIIYQGHHGGSNIYFSDIILPGALPYEKVGIYYNL